MNQEPADLAIIVGLKRDSKRELCGEKVATAFRPEAYFREAPVSWQQDRQERIFPRDDESAKDGYETGERLARAVSVPPD
jgi:hypothetical protein